MKYTILFISFSMMLLFYIFITNRSDNLKKKLDDNQKVPETKVPTKKESDLQESETHKSRKFFNQLKYYLLFTVGIICSFFIALPLNFESIIQQKYENIVYWISGEEQTDHGGQNSQEIGNILLHKILQSDINIKNSSDKSVKDFPFSTEYSEAQVLNIPILKESEEYVVNLPIEFHKYQCNKVPINEDIHGFIVNETYYCNEDDSETSIAKYNYYDLADYWLVLHTVEISFRVHGDFIPDFSGATIMLREKKSQKAVILENSYSADTFVTFRCSTGQYIVEIYKNGIVYASNIFVDESDKISIDIGEKDHYYLSYAVTE